MDDKTFTLKVVFVDGEDVTFKVMPEEVEVFHRGSIFERLFSSGFVSGVIEGKLVIFPMHRVARVEVDPAPLGLPGYMSQPLVEIE